MKTIYISGRISGLDSKLAKRNFLNAAFETFKKQGFDCKIINPYGAKPFLGLKIWICYMITALRLQRKCTHAAFQKNWIDSRGAVIEYYFARFIFKQHIIFLER
jgi:hypothetical protein